MAYIQNFRKFIFSYLLLICLTHIAQGAIIPVGPPPNSIQAAVNAASDGDTVLLSAGTYVGQQVQIINKSINLVGAGRDVSIIEAPGPLTHLSQFFTFSGANVWCIVMVDNQVAPIAQTVNISDLTVDGDNQQDTIIPPIYGNSDRFFAIGYHNADGVISNVHTTNTKESSGFGELAGGGIINASNLGAITFRVENSLIDFYQRIGIDLRGATLTATVTDSTIDRGYLLTPNTSTATSNGIQYSGSATGSITNNIVAQNISTVAGVSGSGILPFGGGANILISGNTVINNDVGIAALFNGNNLTISDNSLDFTITPVINPPVGILVSDTVGLTNLFSNIMNMHSIPSSINMELDSTTNQNFQLQNNQFIGGETGLLINGNTVTGPVITMDSDVFTGTMGYYVQEVAAPNDVWPSSATVTYDGIVAGQATLAEFNFLVTKILDKNTDPTLGLVIAFIDDPLPPGSFVGVLTKKQFFNCTEFILNATFTPSPSLDVVSYEILKNGQVVKTIPSTGPFTYSDVVCNNFSVSSYSVVAVGSTGKRSTPTPLTLL